MRFRVPFVATLLLTSLPIDPSLAVTAIVKDAGAVQLGNTVYRLDGIDAPAIDQLCTDEHADVWTCGIEARDQLAKLIGDKPIHCDDIGVDPTAKKRRLGVCKVEGDPTSLSQLLVERGYALNVEASASGRFQPDEGAAKDSRVGLWRGCFVAPHDFRRGRKDGPLLGAACPADREQQIRDALFPSDPPMPASCNIKGKYAVRARVTGDIGIYHLQACRSYPGLTNPDRWFCSEEDAQAAGFRRAYNCRPPSKGK
ncbi:thermonuclease family protein [Bradyrhizobium sp. ISRA443]|uniref:thermonuclease family protein n=1 Tax=unclassified Bradyrhizobium TaxID=2631580 RepID=UPI0024793D38|nr:MULTISPECIES: thermonuclease family protein [unclassified Bradyrhizobium]WGS02060.1 thermonuclease family protein [Bradyrhizobium sp. ISRA436]WGS08945.1 thermonuclease family protein [Bradyrhizobium sp. ISRA437]WGS15834.1 thermonuclease family protein [Bradyrhizobium sp. ISRA443]